MGELPLDIVLLSAKNIHLFEPYLPDGMLEALHGRDSFGLGAVVNKLACGVLVATHSGNEAEIRWLYVARPRRGQGFARALVDRLAELLGGKVQRLTAAFPQSDDNLPLGVLFAAAGFEHSLSEQVFIYDIPVGEIDGSLLPQTECKGLLMLDEAPKVYLRTLEATLRHHAFTQLVYPITAESYHQASSLCYREGRVVGTCLVRMAGETAELSCLYAEAAAQRVLPALMGATLKALRARTDPDTLLRFWTINDASRRLAAKLTPAATEYRLYTVHKLLA